LSFCSRNVEDDIRPSLPNRERESSVEDESLESIPLFEGGGWIERFSNEKPSRWHLCWREIGIGTGGLDDGGFEERGIEPVEEFGSDEMLGDLSCVVVEEDV